MSLTFAPIKYLLLMCWCWWHLCSSRSSSEAASLPVIDAFPLSWRLFLTFYVSRRWVLIIFVEFRPFVCVDTKRTVWVFYTIFPLTIPTKKECGSMIGARRGFHGGHTALDLTEKHATFQIILYREKANHPSIACRGSTLRRRWFSIAASSRSQTAGITQRGHCRSANSSCYNHISQ